MNKFYVTKQELDSLRYSMNYTTLNAKIGANEFSIADFDSVPAYLFSSGFLGCVAFTIYDQKRKRGLMAHIFDGDPVIDRHMDSFSALFGLDNIENNEYRIYVNRAVPSMVDNAFNAMNVVFGKPFDVKVIRDPSIAFGLKLEVISGKVTTGVTLDGYLNDYRCENGMKPDLIKSYPLSVSQWKLKEYLCTPLKLALEFRKCS